MTKTKLFPLFFLIFLTVICFSAGLLQHVIPAVDGQTDLGARFMPASLSHPLGTDELGRDVLIRLLQGGQVSLIAAAAAALAASLIGTLIGLAAGYIGGRTDALLMRLTDLMISLPTLPLLVVLSALDLQKLGFSQSAASSPSAGLIKIVFLISILGWTTVARLVRARTKTLRGMDFVRAARALGAGHLRIVFRHILPNIMGTIIVATALAAGSVILTELVLSFLGLGIQPPMASWGSMLTHAEDTIWDHAELTFYPGLMIFAAVLSFNALGDRLQESLDPRGAKR